MAKFNEYPTEATPTDDDTLLMFENTSKKNRQTPFSGVWNWIVKKLTDAVISNLQTENKTVIGALNELNNKTNVKFLVNEDLNNCLETNKTYAATTDNTCANKPEGVTSFGMIALNYGSGGRTQILWSWEDVYFRNLAGESRSNWTKFIQSTFGQNIKLHVNQSNDLEVTVNKKTLIFKSST